MSDFPPTAPVAGYVRPHRGAPILVLGILSIVICFICGIVAWVMANGDLREMAAGRMDRSGEGLTKAGKICGIIGVGTQCLAILLYIVFVVIFVGLGVAAGAGG